jgi:hypothetical protein
VARFASEEEVYASLGRTLAGLVDDPELGPHLQRANTVVQYRLTAPEATLTLDLRQSGDPRVVLGPCELEPEVVLVMQAEVAEGVLSGTVNLPVALARGQVCAHGPVAKVLRLVMLGRRRARPAGPLAVRA